MAFSNSLILRSSRKTLTQNAVIMFYILLMLALPTLSVNQRLVNNLIHFKSPVADLQKLALHRTTGELYVGGTNTLYHLSSDLHPLAEVDTKEEGITHFCPTVSRCSQDDNINRILSIDYRNNLLISCGSAFVGTCGLHDLDNFTRVVGWPTHIVKHESVFGEDSISLGKTVVGFFAPFQADDNEPETPALYIGATYNSDPVFSNVTQHAVTAKKLEEISPGEWQFSFAYQDPNRNRNSFINVWDAYKNDYKIKYIFGFNSGVFNYLTTVQRVGVDANRYHSRIVRICKKDKSFYSYTEMDLICRSQDGSTYNILRAAYVGKAAQGLNFEPGEDVLYGIFSPSATVEADSGSGWSESDQPGSDSALCVFGMNYINRRIKKGLQKCFNGQGRQELRFLSANRGCNEAVYRVIDDEFCGTADLQPIKAQRQAEATDVLQGGGRGKSFTSIAVMPIGEDTVAVIGTDDGHIMKFLLQPSGSSTDFPPNLPYKDLALSESPVLPGMVFDQSNESVYVLTSREVFKISLSSCEHYVDCSACVVTHDPNSCGWCGFCSTQSGCLQQGNTTWQRDLCQPVIYKVMPLAGPLEGDTQVTITGDNLGANQAGTIIHEVTVAGLPCTVIENSELSRIVCTTSESVAPRTGPIEIEIEAFGENLSYQVKGTFSTDPDSIFTYVNPVITSTMPQYGKQSGGTLLTIRGNGLNAGNNISVIVLGKTCAIQSISMTSLTCLTMPVTTLGSGKVELRIDAIIRSSPEMFMYVEDPTLERFSPNTLVVNGGQQVEVFGRTLQYVHAARMEITIRNEDEPAEDIKYSVVCNSITSQYLSCLSPNISQSVSKATPNQPITAEVLFLLDNKPVVLSSTNSNISEILFYPDPVFQSFEGGEVVIQQGSSTLTIRGKDLTLALSSWDFQLLVGDKECKVTELMANELICELPDLDATPKNSSGYKVEVRAASQSSTLGYLKVEPKPFPWYAIIIVILVIVTIIVVFVVCYIRKQSKEERIDSPNGVLQPTVFFHQTSSTGDYVRTPMSSAESAVAGIPDENKPLLETINKDLAIQISEVLISEENLKRGDVIGQGHFGCVYKGQVWQDGKSFPVAIKSLLQGDQIAITNFLREGIMMKDFKHPHVLQLIGVCITTNNIPLVILPFMKFGDLLTYIRDPKNELTARDLLEFCRQVADGMAYLAGLKFVHRDLAARNCMLEDNLQAKVADFGLSRDLYEKDYYSAKDKNAKLPVRWMALECLEKNVYNAKTDVWSYGVVMWELLTRGVTPYPCVDNWDITSYLQHGRRLQQPMHCPDHVYQIMMNCWSVSPVDRPSFDDLVKQLTDILMSSGEDQETQLYLNLVPQT